MEYGLRISKRNRQFVLKESIPKIEADGYEAGRCNGPSLNNLKLDWTEPMTTPWNSSAIFTLTNHVLDRLKSNYYPELKYENWMTTDRVFSELKDKLVSSKEEYENRVASNASDSDIDAAESRARNEARKIQKKNKNRRNMRRKTVLTYFIYLFIFAELLSVV